MRKLKNRTDGEQENNLSQSEQLRRRIRLMLLGVALLTITMLAFTSISVYNTFLSNNLLESARFINQYRLASKSLTESVWSYAVTGDEAYSDAYT